MTDHFHRAARDGNLKMLKEASRKDCNKRDDDGMTPTLWSIFEGNFEALRLIIARGGDPEKCDHYGNTALHFAAAKGDIKCVQLLLQYGVNIYAKDIDYHTAKDLAAMNNHLDVLQCLDELAAKEMRKNPKRAQTLQEKATKKVDKLLKEFRTVQEKARKLAEKEQKRLDEERRRMADSGYNNPAPAAAIPRVSIPFSDPRKDSRAIYLKDMKFSDLVNPNPENKRPKAPISSVFRKVQQHKKVNGATTVSSDQSSIAGADCGQPGDFKIGTTADGKRSVRSITGGLRRDSEIMYIPKFDQSNDDPTDRLRRPSRALSQSNILTASGDSTDEKVDVYQPPRGSIFNRPGLGSIAFRNSITALGDMAATLNVEESIGSAGSLKQRKPLRDDDELESDSDDDEENEATSLHFFLKVNGLEEFIETFVKERFDLDSLMLVKESDLVAMGIPMACRLKLMRAITERRAAHDDPGDLEDCHL